MVALDDWRGRTGETWAAQADALDRLLGPSTDAALRQLDPRPGEVVIDTGCGAGRSTCAIAEAVGAEGLVHALDVSAPLLDKARRRCARAGLSNLKFHEADAAIWKPDRPADALFSAFGTKFFDDPVRAMRNLRAALRPEGRMVIVVWGPYTANRWAQIGLETVRHAFGPVANPVPGLSGPFAWSTVSVFEPILVHAGFRDILWRETHSRPLVSAGDDPDPIERGVALMETIGGLAARLRDADRETRETVRSRLRTALAPYLGNGALRLDATAWVIEARP